ncbi:helix-turn-helix transcriptional regulator [Nocardia sp. NPDC051052]|uniref:helix-turn-helix transcriptional regulator n=1 Tax=Nocardia sp. NPDC051052 TaxID=3364322 RepID=UPI0037AA9AC8
MKSKENEALRKVLSERRQALGISTYEVAKRAAMRDSTYWRIETGASASPRVEKLLTIARVLNISCTDMFTSIGWLPSGELPSLLPYMRTKYCELPPAAFEEIEVYFAGLTEHYGVSFEIDAYESPRSGSDS